MAFISTEGGVKQKPILKPILKSKPIPKPILKSKPIIIKTSVKGTPKTLAAQGTDSKKIIKESDFWICTHQGKLGCTARYCSMCASEKTKYWLCKSCAKLHLNAVFKCSSCNLDKTHWRCVCKSRNSSSVCTVSTCRKSKQQVFEDNGFTWF
jgi:hypothetical protein